ncbi:MAG: Fic family protein [Alphaproteobacteria bacterium]|nr:Fic family protein [Alphaproteobacteria bacterium]
MPYASAPDPYCYPGSTVLKNIPDLRSQDELDAFEQEQVSISLDEPFPAGRFSATHYRAIHHHLFREVYAWAGRYRTVRIAKGGNMFCYPENIKGQMDDLFGQLCERQCLRGLDSNQFAVELASFLATLNAIHPFREGNGRTQLAFASVLAANAGHLLNLENIDPQGFLNAMISSFSGNEEPLAKILLALSEG